MTGPLEERRLERLRRLRDLQREAERINRGVARYYDDPVGFARDCIDWRGDGLTDYQQEIIGELPARRRIAVRGPHGLGKGCTASVVILWFALTRDAAGVDWKVPTTAGSWHQLVQYLWPELHKWAGRLRWDVVRDGRPFSRANELQNLNLRLAHGAAFAGASANAALIEGAHADSLLFVFDEAKAIPAGTFDACEGAFSGTGEAFALALSTPGPPQGRFYDIQSRRAGYEDWYARHVTLDEALAAGRISPDWAEQRARQWGKTSAIYVNRVLGEFHAGDEDSVIPLAWAEAAVERWHEWAAAGKPDTGFPRTVGVDVARTGQDRTVLAIRNGPVLTELRRYTKEDTMQTTGHVMGVLEAGRDRTAIVDVIGIGAGVVDRLHELGALVTPFNASGASRQLDVSGELGFTNCLTGDARVSPVGDLLRIYRSRYEGPLFKVEMASGDKFTATPNHQVLTRRGWVPVQSLSVGDQLCDAAARDVPGASGVRPEIDDVPPAVGEVYRAANVLFGSERVQPGSVNFHGDRPTGQVDVVTINRDLLAVSPAVRQGAQDAQLIGALLRERPLLSEGLLSQPLRVRCGDGRVATAFPDNGVLASAFLPLGEGEPVKDEVVGLTDRAHRDSVLAQDNGDVPSVGTERVGQPIDGLSREVTPDDLRFVKVDGACEAPGFCGGAHPDTALAEYPADHVPVNPESDAQRVERLACQVAADEISGIDVHNVREPGRVAAVPWLNAAFAEDLVNGGPVRPVELAQRCERIAGDIPLDEVVSVELASRHGASFVYTLETATGAYSTSNVVHRNCRSEAWWSMRERLDPSANPDLCLPDDEMLLSDLSAPQWRVQSGGKIQVESKDTISGRLGRSTDDGDAAVQAFHPQSLPHTASVRQWSGTADLERVAAATRPPWRRPEDRPRQADPLAPARRADMWDEESFAPQPDDGTAGRRGRPNVRSWR